MIISWKRGGCRCYIFLENNQALLLMNLLAFIQIFEIQIFFAKIKSEDIMVHTYIGLHRVKWLRVKWPRVKWHRVKRPKFKWPMVKRQTVKNATKGKMTKGQNKIKIFYVSLQGYVRLRQFLGRALRLGQAGGLNVASINPNYHKQWHKIMYYFVVKSG